MKARAAIFAGLTPGAWSCLFTKNEDPLRGVMGGYNTLDVHLQADLLNTANVIVRVQDSPDGQNWTTRYTFPGQLVPGGEIGFYVTYLQDYVRCQLYSEGVGKVDATVLVTNPHENPALWCEEVENY